MKRYQIQRLLKISDQEYNTILFETAFDYLNVYFDREQEVISNVSYTSIFWGWWYSVYNNLDTGFLMAIEPGGPFQDCDLQELRQHYLELHKLAGKLRLDNAVLKMINSQMEQCCNEIIETYSK